MNQNTPSDVAEIKEMSEPEFIPHAENAAISISGVFQCFWGRSGLKILPF